MGLDHRPTNGLDTCSVYLITIIFILMEMIWYLAYIYLSSLVFILDLEWDIYNLCLDVNIMLVDYIYNSIP